MRFSFFIFASTLSTTDSFSSVKSWQLGRSHSHSRPIISQLQPRNKVEDHISSSSTELKSKPGMKRKIDRSWTSSTTTITGKWRENFEALQVYAHQHGHTRVPYNYPANPRLGRWVAKQRSIYNEMQTKSPSLTTIRPATILTKERIDALQGIGFSFESPRKRTWNARFDELCQYRALHGDCLVPLQYDTVPGLGIWVRNQRTQYRNMLMGRKQSGNLTPEKLAALQSIGFVWDTQRNDQWKKRFDELVDFKDVYGHCAVPENYHENPSLGIWVVNQRTSYKNFLAGSTGGNAHGTSYISTNTSDESDPVQNTQWRPNSGKSLTKDKIKALESIGFCWNQNQKNWYTMYERLKQYTEERRACLEIDSGVESKGAEKKQDGTQHDDMSNRIFRVPPEDVTNRDLRLWISVQRKEYSNYMHNQNGNTEYRTRSSMTPRRKRALDEIGFPWSVNKQKYGADGPSVDDWTALFQQMREKGIDKDARPKEHWFEGQSLFSTEDEWDAEKEYFSDDDLLDLWNMEDES